ncbi:uncharacterized protein BXZ73DRAFT_99752 [Epithele typhae]|uniref:uncharacterized protein n=1 Tax=Epithele typhae TaxID=378194 RepID=UPI0020073C8E|nr:uncharacterized protein BXZ73DRAFT_99752 [Epithele typhae]KAH9939076.1 hypothetical protein BXZ73DRAFT_99752 [Epithele typhae]
MPQLPECMQSLPATDLDNLAGLSEEEAESWTLARAAEYRQLALTLHSFHNAVVPIHRKLPTEMISEIFAHCWQDGDSRSIRLTHVCRRWRAIAHKTPRFWAAAVAAPGTMFNFEDWEEWTTAKRDAHEAWFKTILAALTAGRPIRRVVVDGLPSPISAALQLHVQRLVELRVTLSNIDDLRSLKKLLSGQVPNLETLGVDHPGSRDTVPERNAPLPTTTYCDARS